MRNEILKAKIRKLARGLEANELLSLQLSGYKKKLHKDSYMHIVEPKKRYTYIDRGFKNQRSGRLLVDPQGNVFGIKAYGQRGAYVGDVDKVIERNKKNNESLKRAILEKKAKGRFGVTLEGVGERGVIWAG